MELTTAQELEQLLAAAREKLDVLVANLRAIDGELDGLATQRKQHRLLQDVCGAFDQLDESGGAELFWGKAPRRTTSMVACAPRANDCSCSMIALPKSKRDAARRSTK